MTASVPPLLLLGLLLSCDGGQKVNPERLWISYSQREVDLVLIDHEPPPF